MFAASLALLTSLSPAVGHAAADTAARPASLTMISAPPGFEDLERPRVLVVDLYFGARKIGETEVVAKPGIIQFREPERVLTLIPSAKKSEALLAALTSELPDNSNLACSLSNAGNCGALRPDVVGVIFDESRFRIDLFVHSDELDVRREQQVFLPSPDVPLSLTSSIGAALAGSAGRSPTYNLQNRTVIGYRNARIRSNSSIASDLGLIFDDLVAELDTNRHRYSAGLFWAPGLGFTGRRRIVGVGFGTQFDTRADAESLKASPLITFLAQPARVEILVDGRLVTSGSYEAGNNLIDTSNLPAGSYPLILRIHESGGAVREERRFFAKDAQIAPRGEPIYYGFVGKFANTRAFRPISVSDRLYYQLGGAWRLSEAVAVDAALLGTQKKSMLEAGAWLISRHGRLRAAGLVSDQGDRGILVQFGSSGRGRLNFNFDLRRVWSSDGAPLIPLPSYVENFGSSPPTGAQTATGSFAQVTGSIAYTVGGAFAAVTGSFRRDAGSVSDYSIGPSFTWPLVRRGGLQLIMQADAQRSRSATAAFAGFRVLFTSGGFSAMSTVGRATLQSKQHSQRSRSRSVGSLSAQWFHQEEDRTQLSVEGALERSVDATTGRANALLYSHLGSARADVLHAFGGTTGSQYGLTLQTGIALGTRAVEIGGRDLNQSALILSVNGMARSAVFDVLVDDVPRARVRTGTRLPIFLEAYRAYRVRLRPVDSAPVSYDSAAREITLFPGNVQHLRWSAEPLFTVFGRAVRRDGSNVSDAAVSGRRGVGQTDQHGYFQIDVLPNEVLTFAGANAASCHVSVPALNPKNDYVSLGKVVCHD
jgi:Mat/Ecp fimbriae outer membrane usher protein